MNGYYPSWPLPAAVQSYVTYRHGGVSTGIYATNNLATHVGDDDQAVACNRAQLTAELGLSAVPQWLEQVHGDGVVDAAGDGVVRRGDAAYTNQCGVACAVLSADCLPVLLCANSGSEIAAVHCGWRGLQCSIIARVLERFTASAENIMAYLGPAISVNHYEVSADVKAAILATVPASAGSSLFFASEKPNHFYLNLAAIACCQLNQLGVTQIYSDARCTYAEEESFFSYRRDGETGRIATLIWRLE